ncbi:MAG TPA: hypothetical protein VFK28_05755 [Sphingomicrobium sp.]|jgi:hypothetical protein|nr:hypothetical protein [Sphingomicrobium sp.]
MPPEYHPGVNHNHQPCGKWAEIQKNPNSSDAQVNFVCSTLSAKGVVDAAIFKEFGDKPIAKKHVLWYLSDGHGVDFVEDDNLRDMLQRDRGVQAAILATFPPKEKQKGIFQTYLRIAQQDYVVQDFRFAFGAIDRLDIEVDFTAGKLHAWFQDRYEWHPYYPGLYSVFDDDAGSGPRPTNCVHAAFVEQKLDGATDFWMKGETTVDLFVVTHQVNDPPLVQVL